MSTFSTHQPPSGVASAATTPTVGVSPASLTNAGPADALYVISGGTVSKIEYKRGATTFDTGATFGSFYVAVGDILVVTHTGAPTCTKFEV